jgi:Putative prokaryotic signal transducing protein
MRKIYVALNLPDAQIILNLLEDSGIPAHLFNTNMQGAVGHIPFNDTYPQVWIVNDGQYARGKNIIREYKLTPIDTRIFRCEKCHEENPANFGTCWNCGVALTHEL